IPRNDPDDHMRSIAAFNLSTMDAKAKVAMPTLIDALGNDRSEEVRRSAASALGSMGPEAVPALINALRDQDPYTRGYAADSIGRNGPEAKAAVPALIEILKNKDESGEIRGKAANSLGRIGPDAHVAVPFLIEAFDTTNGVAAVAIGHLGP